MARVLEGGGSLVRFAFEPLRYNSDGSLNPNFVLNQPDVIEEPVGIPAPTVSVVPTVGGGVLNVTF